MKTIILFCCGMLLLPALAAADQLTLLAKGSTWKYWDSDNAPDANWFAENFDDNAWPSAAAQLGYGDGDETTVLQNSDRISTYFRTTFTVQDKSALRTLLLKLLRDDGAVVYLNGVEIMRSNMPEGAVSHTTLASSAVNGQDEDDFILYYLNDTQIQSLNDAGSPGSDNVLAVEIHQHAAGSSDISFDCELHGRTMLCEMLVQAWNFAASAAWSVYEEADYPGSAWKETSYSEDASWQKNKKGLFGRGHTDVNFDIVSDNITTYFRHQFNVSDKNRYTGLILSLVRRDGAVVYLNGVEVMRSNMPAGVINHLTPANNAAWYDRTRMYNVNLPTDELVNGQNLIAVELHRRLVVDPNDDKLYFDLELQGCTEEVIRGPYLQLTTPGSTIIRWRTASSQIGWMKYGPAPDQLTTTLTEPSAGFDHSLKLSGLSNSTRYYYAIGTGTGGASQTLSGGDEETFFETHPPAGEPASTHIWVVGDPGKGGRRSYPKYEDDAAEHTREVRDAYLRYAGKLDIDLMLLSGDVAYELGLDRSFQTALFEETFEDIVKRNAMWPCIGNHENYNGFTHSQLDQPGKGEGPYYEIFDLPTEVGDAPGTTASPTEAFYSFDYANIHFIVLEGPDFIDGQSTDKNWDEDMKDWLLQDLRSTSQDWTIVMVHYPPYSKGKHDSDSDDDCPGFPLPGASVETDMIQIRKDFLPVLENSTNDPTYRAVDLLLAGHSHNYERSYLLRGHYDCSETFKKITHAVDGGHGDLGDDGCAYVKYSQGSARNSGTVYATIGNSSKSDPVGVHPALPRQFGSEYASLVIDVEHKRLDVRYLTSTGEVKDHFRIVKDPDIFLQNRSENSAADYQASYNISAGRQVTNQVPTGDYRVEAGAEVEIKADNSISLEDGFKVLPGAEFAARISSPPFCVGDSYTPAKESLPEPDVEEIGQKNSEAIPALKVYPVPLSGEATIVYRLYARTSVCLTISDLHGRHVKTLFCEVVRDAGSHHFQFKSEDIADGSYIFTLKTASASVSTPVVLMQKQ